MTNVTFSTILSQWDRFSESEKQYLLQHTKLEQYAPCGLLLKMSIRDGVFLEIRLEFSSMDWNESTLRSMKATTYYAPFPDQPATKAILCEWEMTKYMILKLCVQAAWYEKTVQPVLDFFEMMNLTDEDRERAACL